MRTPQVETMTQFEVAMTTHLMRDGATMTGSVVLDRPFQVKIMNPGCLAPFCGRIGPWPTLATALDTIKGGAGVILSACEAIRHGSLLIPMNSDRVMVTKVGSKVCAKILTGAYDPSISVGVVTAGILLGLVRVGSDVKNLGDLQVDGSGLTSRPDGYQFAGSGLTDPYEPHPLTRDVARFLSELDLFLDSGAAMGMNEKFLTRVAWPLRRSHEIIMTEPKNIADAEREAKNIRDEGWRRAALQWIEMKGEK